MTKIRQNMEPESRRQRLRRCAFAGVAIMLSGAIMVGCARIDDKAETRAAVPGEKDAFPKLSSVPKRPTPGFDEKQVAAEKSKLEQEKVETLKEGEALRRATDNAEVLNRTKVKE